MLHMPHFMKSSMEEVDGGNDDVIFGHALMASCPPISQFEHQYQQSSSYPQSSTQPGETTRLGSPELANLLDLSKTLQLDGEVTPVMAWSMILAHPRLLELRVEDFEIIKGDLSGKARCHG